MIIILRQETLTMNENQKLYSEWESDFYQYLSSRESGVNKHSCTNYIAWMKHLSRNYIINNEIDEATIDSIIESESRLQPTRAIYTKRRDLTNFRSCLRKFVQFIHSDYVEAQANLLDKAEQQVRESKIITATEKEAIIKARVGQGVFRQQLIKMWKGCSITHFEMLDVLMASHIKPWRDSTNEERLSVFNGLLLLPNYDKLFDKGYISFNRNGRIVFSRFFEQPERDSLGISPETKLIRVEPAHLPFLEYHRENCLIH